MSHKKVALFGAAATLAIFAAQSGVAIAAEAAGVPASVSEVIVTAQKRQENIQNVGMSIQAASGDKLTKLGITDTSSLQKIVPGFLFTPTYYGTTVFTIRGVGFQDTSLAGSPTVSVYLDEAPLPFSALTNGATLDLQRVEVLKGPQGTLFGNNATGGAINYIANKPTDTFQAGGDLTYGRFSDVNVQGFVSGPIVENLDARIALQSHTSGAWQKGYSDQAGQTTGGQDFLNGRVALQWKPTDNFKALLTLNGWQDKSYNQMGQLFGFAQLSPLTPLSPAIANYPLAPHTPEAAGWNKCVNTDPFDPIGGQAALDQTQVDNNAGPLVNTYYKGSDGLPHVLLDSSGHPILESEGPGSLVQAGGQPIHCMPPRRDNSYYSGSLRMDYNLAEDLTLTSLTEYQQFDRRAEIDGSGLPVQDYQSDQHGRISSVFQEIRLAGKFAGKGSWIIGANYEYDKSYDKFLQTYNASTASPTLFFSLAGGLQSLLDTGGNPVNPFTNLNNSLNAALSPADFVPIGQPFGAHLPTVPTYLGGFTGFYTNGAFYPVGFGLGPTAPTDTQKTTTYAVYADAEYPILQNLTLQGGVRFTQENKTGETCGNDGGDGTWAYVAYVLQGALGSTSPVYAGPGVCATTGPASANFNSPANGGGFVAPLNQNNVSWRVGLNWKATPDNLFYFNVSKGYKGGSFPTVAMATFQQSHPVVQEGLLAFEGGFKSSLFDKQLTLNGAGFYYDYTDKQILGAVSDKLFGALPSLVNVPKSHVIGFEFSEVYTPEWLKGLTLSGSVSYQHSEVDKSSKNVCDPPTNQSVSKMTTAFELAGFSAAEAAVLAGSVPGTVACQAGHYYGYDAYNEYTDFTGEKFPSAPEWQASVDAEYRWRVRDDITAFVGVNVQYTSDTTTFFVNRDPIPAYLNLGDGTTPPIFGGYVASYDSHGNPILSSTPVGPLYNNHPNNPLTVPAYTLVDLRAGIERGDWRFQIWGHNVTNTWYWTSASHVNDVLLRYTGMPATYGFTLSYRTH